MEIITKNTIEELENSHRAISLVYSSVSEIYESDISFSFRVFKNKNTIFFFQFSK